MRLVGVLLATVAVLAAALPGQASNRVQSLGEAACVAISTENGAPSLCHLQSGMDEREERLARTFLRFPLPRDAVIASAVLRASYVTRSSWLEALHSFDFVADDAWNAETLTWGSQPPATTERIGVQAVAADTEEVAFDLTAIAQREQRDGWLSVRVAALDESAPSDARWSFRLEIVLAHPNRLEAGDAVMLSQSGLLEGIVAVHPEKRLQREIAPLRLVDLIGGLVVDPRDGSLVTSDFRGFLRLDPATWNPSPLRDHDLYEQVLLPYITDLRDGVLYATRQSSPATVVRVDLDRGEQSVVTSGGHLCLPTGLARDGETLIVADACAGLVRVELADGGQAIIPVPDVLHRPQGVVVEPDGGILVAVGTATGEGGGRIVRVDPGGGQGTVAELPFEPGPLAVDGAGRIWVASRPGEWVSADGGVAFGEVDRAAGIYVPRPILDRWHPIVSIAIGADGAPLLAMTDTGESSHVLRFDPETAATRVLAAPLPPSSRGMLREIFFDRDRQLLVVLYDRVLRIDPATGRQTIVVPPGGIDCADIDCWVLDVAMAPDGRLVLLERVRSALEMQVAWIDPATGAITTQLLPYIHPPFAVDAGGGLVGVVGSSDPTRRRITRTDPSTGAVTTIAWDPMLDYADGLAIDRFGVIYAGYADTDGRILRIDPATAVVSLAAREESLRPGHLVVDHAGRILSWEGGQLTSIDPSSAQRWTLATNAQVQADRTLAVLMPRCANGIDDDGDEAIDHPEDEGCASPATDHEQVACGLGVELALPLLILLRRRGRG